MPRKIVCMCVCGLLVGALYPFLSMAGDNGDPEIVDECGDALSYLDILSVRFYEEPEIPDYLFISMKIRDLKNAWTGASYSVHWNYGGVVYAAGLNAGPGGSVLPRGWRSGEYGRGTTWQWHTMPTCTGSYDRVSGIITFKISKSSIGSPQKGDILMNTCAYTTHNGIIPSVSVLSMIKGFRDWTYVGYGDEYGKDYIVQYSASPTIQENSFGDEPEIIDEEGDTIFAYVDVLWASFYENPAEPEYLYIALKLVDLEDQIGCVYAVHWYYDGTHYDASFRNGVLIPHMDFKSWRCDYYIRRSSINTWNESYNSGSFDVETGVITWKLHKSCVGNPQPGDVLTQSYVFTAQRISKLGLIPTRYLFRSFSDSTSSLESIDYIVYY